MDKKNNTSSPYILEVNNLAVDFHTERGSMRAVKNVGFKIRKGETVGIVGESGSGKSVTSMSIMRLIQKPGVIADGEILFNSKEFGRQDILKMNSKDFRQLRGGEIAMIFQEPMTSLNPVYTCGNQVMETILLHQKISKKKARLKVIEAFNRVKLPRPEKIFKSYPHQISGGQKQRVMIAMSLACKPSLLIADEPTTALDVTVQARILKLMQELREDKDTSTIFITHDLGVIPEVADRVIVMYKGQIVEQGPIWDIFSQPQHPYTKGLLACRPRLDMRLKVLPTVSDFIEVGKDGEIKESPKAKFKSIGHALMMNYQSKDELIEEVDGYMSQKPLLEVRNLKTHFPIEKDFWGRPKEFVKAVDDISFEVYPGETLGLVGESGCGKTTLGRSILRLVEPTSGEIIFEDIDINKLSQNQLRSMRKDIQIIFQDPYASLNPRKSIGEIIMEPMRLHNVLKNDKERKDKVIELLETVNLNGAHFNRYPHEFSGGQRQRIAIARALALEPKFIICDESVSALDVSVQAQVLNLLNQLKEKFNLTYIFISHDLSVVKFISDRILVMNKGKLEEIQLAEDLYEKPQTEYTKRLINAIPKGDLEDVRKAMLRRKMIKKKKEEKRQKSNLENKEKEINLEKKTPDSSTSEEKKD